MKLLIDDAKATVAAELVADSGTTLGQFVRDILTDRDTLLARIAELEQTNAALIANAIAAKDESEAEIAKLKAECVNLTADVDRLTYLIDCKPSDGRPKPEQELLAVIESLRKENTALHDDNELLRQNEATRPAMMKSEEMAKLTNKTAVILAQLEAKETERLELRIVQLEDECARQRDWIAGQDLHSDFQIDRSPDLRYGVPRLLTQTTHSQARKRRHCKRLDRVG